MLPLVGRVALVALVGSVALVGLVALARIGDCWKIERLFGCLAFHLSQPFPSMQLVASDASTATAIVDVRRHVWLLVLCLHLAHRCFVITGERERVLRVLPTSGVDDRVPHLVGPWQAR